MWRTETRRRADGTERRRGKRGNEGGNKVKWKYEERAKKKVGRVMEEKEVNKGKWKKRDTEDIWGVTDRNVGKR